MELREGWRRLRRVFRADARREVEDELRFHLEMRSQDYATRGLDAERARQEAERRFGDVERVRRQLERMGELDRRVRRRRLWRGEFGQDVRHAARMMLRSPFAFVVLLATLALAMGATTAVFSVVNAVLMRPLPYPAPDRLVRLWEVTPRGEDHNVVSPGNYVDWSTRARSFAALGAHRSPYGVALTGDGDAVQVMVVDMTSSVLALLGVMPQLGRAFSPSNVERGERVALLSDRMWRMRFGADPAVIGRSVVLDAVTYTVLGVMPAHFDFPSATVDFWRPVGAAELDGNERRSHNWLVVGRLAEGVSRARAQSEMRELAGSLARAYPAFMTGWGVNVTALHGDMVVGVRLLLLVLLGGVVLVLLVACGNSANLLLARAVTRTQEMAVRGALGAGRGRLLRQALTESLLLAATSGLLGLAFAHFFLRGLLSLAPADLPRLNDVHLDFTVLLFAAATTLCSTLLFGMLPALRLARTDLQATLRAADVRAGGAAHARLRSALLIGEVTLSLVLMVGAGLLVRSSLLLRRIDYGYDTDGLVAVLLDLPRARYAGTPAHVGFYEQLLQRVAQLPGVAAVAGTSEPPAVGYAMTFSFAIEGRPATNASGREDPQPLRVVTPDYFRTMGIPVRSGRAFDPHDRTGTTEVVVVNESLARRYWPGENPVGRRISLTGASGPWKEIVGVVGDTRMAAADAAPAPALYLPHAQKTWPWMSWLTLMVRPLPGITPEAIATSVRSSLRQLDADVPVQRVATVAELYGEGLAGRRFATTMLAGFAGAALLLGIVGMYGVLSYTVAQRRRDIGVRMALGASQSSVVGGVVRYALVLALLGVALGTGASLALTRLLRTLLYEVSPVDPLTLGAVALLIMLVAALAALVPAARAARVSPLTVMRE
jgi:predicted permease